MGKNTNQHEKKAAINVLMLLPSLRVGSGVASFAIAYFRKIDKSKVHIDFACYSQKKESYAEEVESSGSKVFYLPPVFSLRKHIKTCREILQNGNYVIIHDNTLINSIPFMQVSKQFVKIRVLHSHSSKLGETVLKAARNRIFLPRLRSLATDYAACSDLAARTLFGKRKYFLIPNVIDSGKFNFDVEQRKRIREQMNVNNKVIVGTVGRCASQKNPFRAFSIMEKVIQNNPDVEYWWVGNGPLLEQMKKYVTKKGLNNKIKLLGNRTDIADLYQAMDVFFMPSKFEGLGIACVEAQITGLPCVVSDVIPHSVAFTNLVKFISLSKTNIFWADNIISASIKNEARRSYKTELANSCFSDENAGDRLKEYYERLLENEI